MFILKKVIFENHFYFKITHWRWEKTSELLVKLLQQAGVHWTQFCELSPTVSDTSSEVRQSARGGFTRLITRAAC